MITGLMLTLLPTIFILAILFIIVQNIAKIKTEKIFYALIAGIVVVLPAIISMKLLGILITITVPATLPLIFFQILSSLNEEVFKYIAVKKFCDKSHRSLTAIFTGGGFALCETLYLTVGHIGSGLPRTYTTLPLHIFTTVLLSKAVLDKRYFILALLLHISYNLSVSAI